MSLLQGGDKLDGSIASSFAVSGSKSVAFLISQVRPPRSKVKSCKGCGFGTCEALSTGESCSGRKSGQMFWELVVPLVPGSPLW